MDPFFYIARLANYPRRERACIPAHCLGHGNSSTRLEASFPSDRTVAQVVHERRDAGQEWQHRKFRRGLPCLPR